MEPPSLNVAAYEYPQRFGVRHFSAAFGRDFSPVCVWRHRTKERHAKRAPAVAERDAAQFNSHAAARAGLKSSRKAALKVPHSKTRSIFGMGGDEERFFALSE